MQWHNLVLCLFYNTNIYVLKQFSNSVCPAWQLLLRPYIIQVGNDNDYCKTNSRDTPFWDYMYIFLKGDFLETTLHKPFTLYYVFKSPIHEVNALLCVVRLLFQCTNMLVYSDLIILMTTISVRITQRYILM